MRKYLLLLLLPTSVYATTLVIEAGKPLVAVTESASGYTIANMDGSGVTQVMDLGNMTAVVGGGQPSTFLIGESITPELVAPNTEVGLDIQ
jgi:hypothetical protein